MPRKSQFRSLKRWKDTTIGKAEWQLLVSILRVGLTSRGLLALAKVLTTYAKNNPLFVFKTGVVEGRVVGLADLEQLANLPSKEELISKLMFLLNSQARRLATAVGGVARSLAVVLSQAAEQKKFNE